MVKINASTVALLSLFLGIAVFSGQPVAANGRGGGKKEDAGYGYGKKEDVGYGKKEDGKDGKEDDAVRATVKTEVVNAIAKNPGVGPALIRLVFHDCWVNGCDASVLLDSDSLGSKVEKKANNNIGLDGFYVIDDIKKQLVAYGQNVSCADILVLAAREATSIVSRGKIQYDVKTGRMDGVVSSAAAADAVLPPSTFDVDQLIANFDKKGFNETELAALSGAHSCGVAHRSSFQDRLNGTTPIDSDYLRELSNDVDKQKTVQGTQDPIEPNNIRDKDDTFQEDAGYDKTGVDTSAKGVLDNSYYHANLQNRQLFRSDWELRTNGDTADAMDTFKDHADEWAKQFGKAMEKLSKLLPDVNSPPSEIRTNCRAINPKKYY